MEKICIVDQNRCPICGQRMIIVDNQCKFCNVEIRKININRIRNSDFLRGVCKYDVHGNLVHIYKNVYECYPVDSKKSKKMRAKVIEACNGKVTRFEGFQWRFADEKVEVAELKSNGSAKKVIQVGFDGKVIAEYQTIGEAQTNLGYTYATITKACKRKVPPQNAKYFLFFKVDYCDKVFENAYKNYLKRIVQVKVYNPEKDKIGVYDTYEDVARALNISATSVSNWCNGKCKPSGKFAGFAFEIIGATTGDDKTCMNSCKKTEAETCSVALENRNLRCKNNELLHEVEELRKNNEKYYIDTIALKKDIYELQHQYRRREPVLDKRVHFMMPIGDFIKTFVDTKEIAGVCVYVLCDENGRRYVGQSNRDNYSRIKEHFDGTSKDRIYESYLKGIKFYVEQIVVGWKDIDIFNVNDAETYYIAHFDSFNNGYNQTKGNHQTNKAKIDVLEY